ncbi:MAG: extracellular solute-binding protein [Lachnospiraceae bacterium]|nr:extracellular solute-binding protein [Lachnospiraceae bacterium]
MKKKKLKKLLSLCLIFILLSGVISACGSTDTPPQANANTPNQNNTASSATADGETNTEISTIPADISGELVLWMTEEVFATAIIEGFNAIYPNVVVNFEEVGFAELASRLTLDGPSGIGPDVIGIADNEISHLAADGFLEPFPADMQARIENQILEAPVTTVTIDGQVYGAAYTIENIALFYNKDLVDGPPQTMEEIIEFAKTYNDPSIGKYAMRWPTGDGFHNYLFLSTHGWQPMGPNGDDWKNPEFDSPEVARGLADYLAMKAVFDYSNEEADYGATVGAFQRGETPYCITGSWAVGVAKEVGLNFGTAKIPTINGVQPKVLSSSWAGAVSSYSKNFDAAFALAEFMASDEMANITYNIYGGIPALKDLSVVEGLADDEWIIGMAEQSFYTVPVPSIPEMRFLWQPWAELFMFAWDGLLTIEESQMRAMETYEMLLNGAGLSMYD